ncbi:hypothetical protein OQA88_1629 [Cercophora sp. LCS_1]
MDTNHHMLTLLGGEKLYIAPLGKTKLKKVLDIGTGTGVWAIDFADAHPDIRVISTNLSPNQPNAVPPNLSFEISDATANPLALDARHF